MADTTRRLSITLLLVAPLISAQRKVVSRSHTSEDLEPGVRTDPGERIMSDVRMDPTDAGVWGDFGEDLDVNQAWLRNRRDVDVPGETMETAEQVLFNPFHHRHIVEDHLDRQRQIEDLRRQSLQMSSPVASSASQPLLQGPNPVFQQPTSPVAFLASRPLVKDFRPQFQMVSAGATPIPRPFIQDFHPQRPTFHATAFNFAQQQPLQDRYTSFQRPGVSSFKATAMGSVFRPKRSLYPLPYHLYISAT